MRIAVSGTHVSGKSTLVKALEKEFSSYTSIKEPYFLLEEKGYLFTDPPSIEDFEEQLSSSIEAIRGSRRKTIFDRSPLDFLAYALSLEERGEEIDVAYWISKIEPVIELLDWVVFVPIEKEIPVPSSEDLGWRREVDELLQEILLEDSLGLLGDISVIEVRGSLENRVEMVKENLS